MAIKVKVYSMSGKFLGYLKDAPKDMKEYSSWLAEQVRYGGSVIPSEKENAVRIKSNSTRYFKVVFEEA